MRCRTRSTARTFCGGADAREAARLLYGQFCSDLCCLIHSLIWTDETRVHVERIGPVPSPPLAVALAQAYPTRKPMPKRSSPKRKRPPPPPPPPEPEPRTWPTPPEFNRPLVGAQQAM